jgi:hypothetical protein
MTTEPIRNHSSRAWVGGQKIEHPTLRRLLDDLEEMFRPDTHASRTETPQ